MMTSDAKRALAKTIRELREKIILPDLRGATERAYPGGPARGTWPRRVASALRVPGPRVGTGGTGAATASSRRWRTHIVRGPMRPRRSLG